MTEQLLTCGVENHNPSCLCDVKLKPGHGEINVTIPYTYRYGAEIAERLGLGVPWTSYDLAVFLQALDRVDYLRRRPHLWSDGYTSEEAQEPLRKLNVGQLQHLKDLIIAGVNPTPAMKIIEDEYGIKISRSYVTRTKTRMKERGEL